MIISFFVSLLQALEALKVRDIKNNHIFIFIFIVSHPFSFSYLDEIPIKLEQIRRIKDDCRHFVMLVGNKSDLDSQREVCTWGRKYFENPIVLSNRLLALFFSFFFFLIPPNPCFFFF